MKKLGLIILALAMVLCVASPAAAVPVNIYFLDGPQDPLVIPEWVHELGESVFPSNEEILSFWDTTGLTACADGPVYDDPMIANVLVTMTNLTGRTWYDVHYVADPETSMSNYDGYIGNAGMGDDAQMAFRIDWLGVNTPLVSESISNDSIFQIGETWEFIIQDYGNTLMMLTPFNSIGIASSSTGLPSTGSIIARVPEPGTMLLLGAGLLGLAAFGRKKYRKLG